MATEMKLPLRDARDRVIDLLRDARTFRLGKTYPLQDLPVRDDQLKVAFGSVARIPIENSQPGVTYQLFDPHKKAVGDRVEGNGGTLLLPTPEIQEDITYRILATKIATGLQAFLHEPASVKVGLNSALRARIVLEPPVEGLGDGNPRLVDYQTPGHVWVQIDSSQEGVVYRLIKGPGIPEAPDKDEVISEQDVAGRLEPIRLLLKRDAITEDLDVRIRATKVFESSQGQSTTSQTVILDPILPLKVRARADLPVAAVPSPVVDFGQDATIKIGQTQASASYRLFAHRILDREFIHGPTEGPVILVSTGGEPVQVRPLPDPRPPAERPGYRPAGDAQRGNGGDLSFTLPGLADDTLIVIQAEKTHDVPGGKPLSSAVELAQQAVILFRPNPAQALRLRVFAETATTSSTMQVSGGQPGVYYFFRRDPSGPDVAEPAYFHKRDDEDDRFNKGLGQLALEVDFAIAADPPPGSPLETADRSEAPPELPILAPSPPDLDATLHVRAMKAQTKITTEFDRTAEVPSLPKIGVEGDAVDNGAPARIRVTASRDGETYQPFREGTPAADARTGNGKDLRIATLPLTDDTTFDVVVTRPNAPGIAVERVFRATAAVRPRGDLAVSIADSTVDPGGTTRIRVDSSQHGVDYRPVAGDGPLGTAVAGDGGTIFLATGPIEEDTTFAIRANRAGNFFIFKVLNQQVSVTLRPAPLPPPPPPSTDRPDPNPQSAG